MNKANFQLTLREDDDRRPRSLLVWLSLPVIGLFLLLGIIGLVLPIIPGVLFLFLGFLMASKVSRRVRAVLEASPLWARLIRRWRALGALQPLQQVKLLILLACRSVLEGGRRLFMRFGRT